MRSKLFVGRTPVLIKSIKGVPDPRYSVPARYDITFLLNSDNVLGKGPKSSGFFPLKIFCILPRGPFKGFPLRRALDRECKLSVPLNNSCCCLTN